MTGPGRVRQAVFAGVRLCRSKCMVVDGRRYVGVSFRCAGERVARRGDVLIAGERTAG